MKEKQNRALLEAKEKLKFENPSYQELRRIEINDVDLEKKLKLENQSCQELRCIEITDVDLEKKIKLEN